MSINTHDLRKASVAVFLAAEEVVAADLSSKLIWAANEIDRLHRRETELAEMVRGEK